jgi:glycosyltransferase involved in cell wall biosynthesis
VRILFITLESPFDADRGARVRDRELIRRVAEEHDVGVLPVLGTGQRIGDDSDLAGRCEVLAPVTVDQRAAAAALRLPRHVRSRRPLASLPYVTDALIDRVEMLGAGAGWDVVQVEHSLLAPCVDVLDSGCAKVLSLHNLGLDQYMSMARNARSLPEGAALRLKAGLQARLERSYLPRFDRVVVVSERDRRLLAEWAPGLRTSVVPNGIDPSAQRPPEGPGRPGRLLFVGNLAYPPNAQAVIEFCRRDLPLVLERCPGAKLVVVGPDAPRAVRALSGEAVEVVGRVADLGPWYGQARLVVVPLRAGGGTRLKVLEAMAYGRCVVSTPFGVEGLAVRPGREVLLAPPGRAFADRVAEALLDGGLCAAVAARGRRFVERHHDWNTAAGRLLSLYAETRAA